jgi:ABC-2 type transport system ATP-binding protein
VSAAAPDIVLDVRGVTVRYGSARGIDDVTLQVPAGQVTGLLGPNGSGKTTLLRSVLDLVHPSTGSIEVVRVDSKNRRARARVAYLPGDLSFPPRLNGYALLRRFSAAGGGLDQTRVDALAKRLGIDLSRQVGTLSRGNRQKVGLVLAFAKNADLLLLDEPTSGLDPLLQREFASLVGEVVESGSAVVLSSHVMSELEDLADRVAVLREGRLVAVETIEQLRARARQRLRVRTVDPNAMYPCCERLASVPGVEARIADSMIDVSYVGDVDGIIKTLATFAVQSVESVGGELDEVLLDFYSDDRYAPKGGA